MSTISTTTHRTASMNLFVALAITLVAILAFAAVPSVVTPKPALIPVTGNQNVYVDFLRGEKEVFANAVNLGTVFFSYLAGEKATYASVVVEANDALWVHNTGEKTVPFSVESALLDYRMGEKKAK